MRVNPNELLRSDEQIRAELKISMPFMDTKIFLPYEREYFHSIENERIARYNTLMREITTRKADPIQLTKDINDIRDKLSSSVNNAKNLTSMRSSTFFPVGKKKSDQAYRTQPLEEKVTSLPIGKFCQLMDVGKICPRLIFTKPVGDAELRTHTSPMYVSILNSLRNTQEGPQRELFNQFANQLYSVIANGSQDYDRPNEINDAVNNAYRAHNALLASMAAAAEDSEDE
jgi:hypothetical protein